MTSAGPNLLHPSAEPLRTAALVALAAHIGVGVISLVLFLAAFQLRTDWFADPAAMIEGGPASAELLRWGATADLLSYYLPTAVVAYVLWRILRPRSALVADLSTLAALGYVLAGGSAAALLAMLGPMLMHDYAAPGADQASIALTFRILNEAVYRAIWQFLDALLLAAWWVGLGLLLRADQPRLALLSFSLGTLAVIGAGLTVLGLSAARDAMLGMFFIGWMAWSVWLLLLLWRRAAPFSDMDRVVT